MLLVIAGAGASFDSVLARSVGQSALEATRLPLADALFEPRGINEEIMREIPYVMQIAPLLHARRDGESVEDVLAVFASEAGQNPRRHVQLAAVRFYLQAVISRHEDGWYRQQPVPLNMMVLLDQIENARKDREPAIFVTFNYDRIIEHALENSGQRFRGLDDYVRPGLTNLIKLHGSVDWARSLGRLNIHDFGGTPWRIAGQIASRIAQLPEPGNIVYCANVPNCKIEHDLALPAIAIPTKIKDRFECPPSHVERLESLLPHVHAILTIGWRGSEQHFLRMLNSQLGQSIVEVICVGGTDDDCQSTISSLRRFLPFGHFQPFSTGFSDFLRQRAVDRLLRVAWRH